MIEIGLEHIGSGLRREGRKDPGGRFSYCAAKAQDLLPLLIGPNLYRSLIIACREGRRLNLG
jgi:hypothetical protein